MSKTTILAGLVLALTAGTVLAQPSGAADEAAKKLTPYVYMRDAGGNKVFLESQFWRNDPNYDARVLKRMSDVMAAFEKLGYKGIESCELTFDDCRVPAAAILGGEPGKGFAQMMKGLETGRIQVASRALGVATAALEDALRYAQERESFGQPIWKHQAVGHYLADMATKLTAARQLTLYAADRYDAGDRADMEAGMAKLFASEVAMEIALNAVRIHGGYGYSTEFDVERYFRDAPLMIVGEGTNEIQRNVIVSQLVARGGI